MESMGDANCRSGAILRCWVVIILAATVASAVLAQRGPPSLPDVIKQSATRDDLSMYTEVLRNTPEALEQLERQRRLPGGVTLFAPIDRSLSKLSEKYAQCLGEEGLQELATVGLQFGAVPGHHLEADLRNRANQSGGSFRLPTVLGDYELVVSEGQSKNDRPPNATGVFVDGAQILAENGFNIVATPHVIVHAIDRPVLPPEGVHLLTEYCAQAAASVPPPTVG